MNYDWSPGKELTDELMEMGFLDGPMTFRRRVALSRFLDQWLESRDRERQKHEENMKMFRQT